MSWKILVGIIAVILALLAYLVSQVDAKWSAIGNVLDDGTTSVVFSPEDFLARLASLAPRPRSHLTRYHGVLAPNAPFRPAVVPASSPAKSRPAKSRGSARQDSPPARTHDESTGAPLAPLSWLKG